MKTTANLCEIGGPVIARPWQRVAPVVVEAIEDGLNGVPGIDLFAELLDHLGLVEVADRRGLHFIGPGGYSGGEFYRPVVVHCSWQERTSCLTCLPREIEI